MLVFCSGANRTLALLFSMFTSDDALTEHCPDCLGSNAINVTDLLPLIPSSRLPGNSCYSSQDKARFFLNFETPNTACFLKLDAEYADLTEYADKNKFRNF
jgi:hypothetical protein